MRIMLLSLVGAASALAIASPAAAQWVPQPSPYGYGAPGYGYDGYNAMASLQGRLARIRGQIIMLSREQRISTEQSRHLFNETRELDSRIREESYEGDGRALRQLEEGVERLEQRVRYAASYGYRSYGNPYGYNGYYGGDRDDHRWGDDDGDD